jgi:CCR4-NOT transcription complex subunit 1
MDPDAMEMVKFEVELLLKEQKLSMEHFEILSHESVLQSKEMMETIMSPRYKSQLCQNKDEGFQVPIATTPTDPRSLPTSMGNIHPPQPQRMNSQPSMEQPPMPSYTPQYYYDKVDVSTDDMSTLLPYIKVRENLPIVQALGGSQQVKLFLVAKAFSQCFLEQQPLCDLIERQIDRNSQIAAIATEALIKKDFALEIDDHLMSSCANYLSRYLAAGMSMNSLANKEIGFARNIQDRLQELIKQKLVSTPDEIINENAKILVEDNIELFICFIQKRTSHQAIRKVEARLLPEIRTRQRCRTDPGLERQFVQSLSNIRQYHLAVMPEQIRLTPQGVKQEQLRVYEEFAVNVPGFIPSAPTSINQRQAAQAAQAQAVQAQPQMNPAAPATQAWLSSNLVPLYKKHFETFKSKMAEIPRQDVGIPAADIRGMMQVLQTLTDGLQTAATTRDLESTTKFIKNLHYCFIVAFRKSHDPHAGSDEDRYWKSFASLFALCLREMQASFDQEVSPNWFANRVLYSMDIQASTSQTTGIIDPFYLDPRYTEEMKLLLLNKIVLPDQYDKFLQHSIIQVAKCTLDQHATMFKLGALSPRQYLDRIIQFCIDLWVSLLANPAPTGPNKGDELVQEFAETIPIIVNNFNSHPFNSLSEETRSKVHEFKTRYLDAENTRFKIQMSNGSTAQQMMQSGMSEAKKDLRQAGAEFKNNTARQLLEQWVKIFSGRDAGRDSTRGFSAYVAILNEAHILKTDECIKRFIRCCTEICVDVPSNLDDMKMRLNVYQQIDAFVRLVCLLIKHSGDTTNPGTKVNLLNQVLGIVIGVCLEHQQQRGKDFDQMPFQRIFIMLFYELCAPEEVLVSINWHTLQAFTQAYHHLRPAKAPGFVFAWIELIGYRTYVSRMMSHTPEKKGWPMYAQLLSDMIKFMAPHLRNPSTMSPAFKQLYDGMLRLLLVLFHDYPQFLLSYHYAFCDIVPPNCIQLRNLILSAYPKHIADDPQYNTQKLILDNDVHEKLKLMGDMYRAPSILTKYENSIKPDEFKQKLELYLKDRQSTEFLTLDLVNYLMKTKEDQRTTGVKWNTLVINAVVIFVGEQAITQILGKQQAPNPDTVAHNSFMDIYQSLAVSLDTEGRYMFLNAIANQLRYPNVHTWYFMEVTLHLFAESGATVREQISRVMLERVLLQAPHPWGTLVTCLLMMKRQDFWEAEFVNSHPNIRKQLELFYEKALRQGVTYQKAPSLTET